MTIEEYFISLSQAQIFFGSVIWYSIGAISVYLIDCQRGDKDITVIELFSYLLFMIIGPIGLILILWNMLMFKWFDKLYEREASGDPLFFQKSLWKRKEHLSRNAKRDLKDLQS